MISRCHFVILSVIFIVAPVGAKLREECRCLTQMVYDIIRVNDVDSITIVFAEDEGVLSPRCVVASGLMKKLWNIGIIVNSLHYQIGEDIFDHNHYVNFVGTYSNASSYFLQQANEKGSMINNFWLMISTTDKKDIYNRIQNIDAYVDSNFLVAAYSLCDAQIESPYRVGPKTGVIIEKIGSWNISSGYVTNSKLSSYDRRSDFRGYPMQGTGVTVFDFFTTYLKNFGVSGYVGDIVTTLKKTHNFTLSYEKLKGYAYGSVIDQVNNTWNGMVGELQSRRADLTVSELSITQERSEVVGYTQPIYMVSRKLFVATSEDFKKKLLAYYLPMESSLYLTIFLTMVIMMVVLVIIDHLRRRLLLGGMEVESPIGFDIASWYMVSALLQQGCANPPSYAASRIVFWFAFFLSVIVYTSYSATLVSQLAVERPAALPFSNLLELSSQSDWNAGCNENDLFQVTASQTCQDSPTEECRVLKDVWTQNVLRRTDNLVSNYKEGLQKVLNEKYVFIGVGVTTNNYIRQMSPHQACKVKELPGSYLTGGIAIGLQHMSPFKIIFNKSIQKMRENGLLEKLAIKYLSAKRLCSAGTVSSAELMDVATIFIILLAGISLSIVIVIIEIVVYAKRQKVK